MSQLAFFASDTLGVTLYARESGLHAQEFRDVRIGNWNFVVRQDVQSDIITHSEITFWLKIGEMRAYVIVRQKEAWLFVCAPIPADALKATGLKERLIELRSHIKGCFRWCDDAWKKMPLPSEVGI